jgi:hypothetical protein
VKPGRTVGAAESAGAHRSAQSRPAFQVGCLRRDCRARRHRPGAAWHQALLDVGALGGLVDRLIEQSRRNQLRRTERRGGRVRLPYGWTASDRQYASREGCGHNGVTDPLVGWTPRRDARFVDEDVLSRIVVRQRLAPQAPGRWRHQADAVLRRLRFSWRSAPTDRLTLRCAERPVFGIASRSSANVTSDVAKPAFFGDRPSRPTHATETSFASADGSHDRRPNVIRLGGLLRVLPPTRRVTAVNVEHLTIVPRADQSNVPLC